MSIRIAPKTEAIYLFLKRQIEHEEYPDGMLPPEPELATQLRISRKTLRSALMRLALEGRIVRIKGEGTFIKKPEEGQGCILVLEGMSDGSDITNPYSYILPGIQQEATLLNLRLERCKTIALESIPQNAAVSRIKHKDYIGVIFMNSFFTGKESIVHILKKSGLPVLLPHAFPIDGEKTGFAVLGTDYRQIMRDGLQYLANLGHRRIAYLSYNEYRIDRKGYFQIVEELGLDKSRNLYAKIPSSNNRNDILDAIAQYFDTLKKMPTAVFCFSDFFAFCLYDYLHHHNLRIPDDVAVLSIGGMIGCDFLMPPLSSLDFGCLEIGRLAVRTIQEMRMKNELTRPFEVTPHHLTERESTQRLI